MLKILHYVYDFGVLRIPTSVALNILDHFSENSRSILSVFSYGSVWPEQSGNMRLGIDKSSSGF